jgi:hypothetical protein
MNRRRCIICAIGENKALSSLFDPNPNIPTVNLSLIAITSLGIS